MNAEQVNAKLESLDDRGKIMLLLTYGHSLTIMARDSYEFQGGGVIRPTLLRGVNEILHRVFQAVIELEKSDTERFVYSGISNWISCEGKEAILQYASSQAFERAVTKCAT